MAFMDRFSLKDWRIVVTGGAQGIGKVVAAALADCGAHIGIFDVKLEEARSTAEAIAKDYGRKAKAYQVDVTKPDEVEKGFAAFLADFGGLEGVFNNAGIALHKPTVEVTHEEWLHVLDVNLNGIYAVAREAGKYFLKEGKKGSIVNTASMSATIVNVPQCQAAYNASKAAVVHLTKSLAVEWAQQGVRVNCISPGYTQTELTVHVRKDWRDVWTDMTPVRRMGTPDELAGAVVYLLSDAASFTSGCDLIIDGAFTCI